MSITETRPGPTSSAYSPTPPSKRNVKRILSYVGVGLLGLALGSASAGGSKTEAEVIEKIVTVDPTVEREAALNSREQALDARAADLDGKAVALDVRDAAVSGKEAAKKASTFVDGVYQVGVDVQPGTYATDGVGDLCYADTKSAAGGIMEQEVSEGHVVFTISPAAKTFSSSNCGTWTKR